MKLNQRTRAKERKVSKNQITNMKGSRSGQGLEKKDFLDSYASSKYPDDPNQKIFFEKLLEAFRTLSEEAPETFEAIAPEMLQRSIWSWKGADPLLSKKFNNWILGDYQWTPFTDILPDENLYSRYTDVAPIKPETLSRVEHEFLNELNQRFYGDYHRWDATTRDQFIILGSLSLAGGGGVRQGKLIHSLGMGLAESGIKGSNTVRAAKIALSRLSNPFSITLFAPATGHGTDRLHSIATTELAELIQRYILHHDASALLPPSPVELLE